VSVTLPYVCPVFNIWLEYPELLLLLLLFLIACYVFFISSMKHSAHLPYVFQWVIQTFHLVYATFFILIYLWLGFYYVLYCVSCSECYFYLCFFKKFLIFFVSFLLYVKIDHFIFWCAGLCFCSVCVVLNVSCFSFYDIHCYVMCLV
jgi:hypothetical protein